MKDVDNLLEFFLDQDCKLQTIYKGNLLTQTSNNNNTGKLIDTLIISAINYFQADKIEIDEISEDVFVYKKNVKYHIKDFHQFMTHISQNDFESYIQIIIGNFYMPD